MRDGLSDGVRKRMGGVKLELPFRDLRGTKLADLRGELVAAAAITVMGVPQGIAYALIAGLPPAMGLYAGAVPAIVGSLLRSSRHVVVGPTNAISLLFASSIAARMEDPIAAAATLALMVGVLQIGAGLLRLGALVDYISTAVVTGYITGAATLIAVGQLPNLTGTPGTDGDIFSRLVGWLGFLPQANPISVVLGLATLTLILRLRQYLPRGVPALIAMGLATVLTWALDLPAHGVRIVADLAPVPAGLPPLVLPSPVGMLELGAVAVAAMVLSLVESTSVARALAAKTGQRLDLTADFVGLGAANVAAAFTGAYPVSGSLSRSALNHALGATTRLAGAISGVFVLLVLLGLGPIVDHAPIAGLAGLILVVAWDVIDPATIKSLLHSGPADRYALLGTILGAWLLPLDQAIYLGVGISIVLFLRRARMLAVRELLVDRDLRLHEVDPELPIAPELHRCRAIRILHVEGPLFFGSASELDHALREVIGDERVQVLVVRLKRAQGVDYTAGAVLARAHDEMASQGRHLMLVGMREDVMQRLEDIGVVDTFESEELFPTQPGWFVAMNQALARALELVEADGHDHRDDPCAECPIHEYVRHREEVDRVAR